MHSDLEVQQLIQSDFFKIHKENVLGEELDVFKNRPRSLIDFLNNSAHFGDKPYLIFKNRTLAFSEHLELVKNFSSYLKETYDSSRETGLLSMPQTLLSGSYLFGL